MIMKKQIEIVQTVLKRLPVACAIAGFVNAPQALTTFETSFTRLTNGLLDAANDRIEAIDSLTTN